MNERILDMARQSGATDEQGGHSQEVFCFTKSELSAFAELIVRECARRCEDIAIKHQVEETTYAAGKKAGAFECAKDLKQHFGVQ